MPKSPREMMEAIARNLPERTGRSLQEWARLVKAKGPKGTKERVAWLRQEHQLGGPTAMVIVAEAESRDLVAPYEQQDALIDAMYSGARAGLRPIYETVLKAATSLGKDVTPSARKSYVTLSRRRQFAVIQPSTSSRVDLGLVLPGERARGRLTPSQNVGGGRITHAIALARPADFDAEARRWLKAAYEQDA
jgi:hypothetical protein